MEKLLEAIAKRIRDELLLWILAMGALAVVAGLRDRVTFIAVLFVGALLIALRLLLARRKVTNIPMAIRFMGPSPAQDQLVKCGYELRDSENNLKKKGELAFSFDVNGWVCYLPKGIEPEDILRLSLTDQAGGNWEAGPSRPLFGTIEARKV